MSTDHNFSFSMIQIIRKAKFVATLGPWIHRHRQAVILPIIENFIKVYMNVYFFYLLLFNAHL